MWAYPNYLRVDIATEVRDRVDIATEVRARVDIATEVGASLKKNCKNA